MLPDSRSARIIALEKQALDPLFEGMKELAVVPRARRLIIVVECQRLMAQFRAAYAERRRRRPLTERMIQLLDEKITELAQATSEPREADRCGVCSSLLEKTRIGTFCSPCLDQMLPFYDWLESENKSFSRTGQSI